MNLDGDRRGALVEHVRRDRCQPPTARRIIGAPRHGNIVATGIDEWHRPHAEPVGQRGPIYRREAERGGVPDSAAAAIDRHVRFHETSEVSRAARTPSCLRHDAERHAIQFAR